MFGPQGLLGDHAQAQAVGQGAQGFHEVAGQGLAAVADLTEGTAAALTGTLGTATGTNKPAASTTGGVGVSDVDLVFMAQLLLIHEGSAKCKAEPATVRLKQRRRLDSGQIAVMPLSQS